MNKRYRLVWQTATQSWVPASELARSHSRNRGGLAAALLIATGLCSGSVSANPADATVVSGNVAISTAGAELRVTQSSDKAIINWGSFSIGEGETTRFVQPSSNSIALNRIIGQDPSRILGTLRANGQVFLVNPNGIVFGKNSVVDVHSLVATTFDIDDQDFLSGRFQFNQTSIDAGSIINEGSITIAEAGVAAFVAPGVRNDGIIQAQLGRVALGSGTGFTLDLYGDDLIHLSVDPQTTAAFTLDGEPLYALVENNGVIEAQTVVLTANAARDIVDNVINMTGVVHATEFEQQGGKIIIGGGGTASVNISGSLDASSSNGAGGDIRIDATESIVLESTSEIRANGETGGEVIAFVSDQGNLSGQLTAQGLIEAKGSADLPDSGGFVETSAAKLSLTGIDVDTGGGVWLLDPYDFSIGNNVEDDLSVGSLVAALLLNDVTIQTFGGLSESPQVNCIEVPCEGQFFDTANGNIDVNASVSWSSENALTLQAYNDINIQSTGSLSSQTGSINLTAGWQGTSGNILVAGDITSANGQTTLTASSGSITTTGNGVIQSNSIELTAQSIGNTGSSLATRASTLSFNASAGSAFILNNTSASPGSFSVSGSASQSVSIVNYGATFVNAGSTVSAGTSLTITANSPLTINGTLTGGAGGVSLTAANSGNLTVNGSVTTTGGTIALNAPGGTVGGTNIPAGAVITQAPVTTAVITTVTSLDTTADGETVPVEVVEQVEPADTSNTPETVSLTNPGLIYLDIFEDTWPPSGPTSTIPLPVVTEIGIVPALIQLFEQAYTPMDRSNFYASLTVLEVVTSLREVGEFELADFFEQTAETGLTNEAELIEVLAEAEVVDDKQTAAYLGVFVKMRRVAMTKLLGLALDKLKQDPSAADVIDEGISGGDISIITEDNLVPSEIELLQQAILAGSDPSLVGEATAAGSKAVDQAESSTATTRSAKLIKTDDGLAVLKGQVESDSKLLTMRVNGRWAYIDENGQFDVTVPVPKGMSVVSLEVFDPSGKVERLDFNVESKADGVLAESPSRRIALLIGVEEYDFAIPELETPVSDIEAIADRLESEQGFETLRMENPSKEELLTKLQEVSKGLSEGDSLMVYYAGHGYMVEETGRGYWLPRDASPNDPGNWVSNRDVARLFHRTAAKQIMMVSDSCYSGAFANGQALEGELSDPSAARLRAVMGLSSGGETPVWDGGADGHSIFAATMLDKLQPAELRGLPFYTAIRDQVVETAPQVPGYGAMIMPGYDLGADYILPR